MPDALFRTDVSPPSFPLFDCHVHLGPSDTGEVYYPHLTGPEYLALMDAAGVTCACAFPPMREAGYRAANAKLAAWAATTGGRILPFARLGGRRLPVTEPALWMVRRKLSLRRRSRPADLAHPDDLDGFAGVKLLPHLDGLPSEDLFEAVARRRMPVLIHAGRYSPPRWIARTVLPRLRGPLILAHLGAFPCQERMLEDAVALARRHAQVFLDTSGAWMASFIRYAVERVPDKILFGSDAPLAHPLVAWQHVESVVQDARRLERIGRGTAREIFGDAAAREDAP